MFCVPSGAMDVGDLAFTQGHIIARPENIETKVSSMIEVVGVLGFKK